MIRQLSRTLFFTVPKLESLSDPERNHLLQSLQESYNNTFNKDFQQKTLNLKETFSPSSIEKIELILDLMQRLNTFEIMALRKSIKKSESSEYNWPVLRRPNEFGRKMQPGIEVAGIGKVLSPADLVNKIIAIADKKKEAQKVVETVVVQEVKVEKSTFNLVLVGFDAASKVKFIKCVKDVLGLGLKESKDKVEEVAKGPVVLFKSVSKESHGKILDQLIAAGGQVEFQ